MVRVFLRIRYAIAVGICRREVGEPAKFHYFKVIGEAIAIRIVL